MEDFAVTCQLVPGVPHLLSGSCSSPRVFGLDFLQTPPHGDALALLLAFGSADTWHGDLHPVSSVPCLAHTCVSAADGACTEPGSGESLPAPAVRCRQEFCGPVISGAFCPNDQVDIAVKNVQ